jgi:hypothetical protein
MSTLTRDQLNLRLRNGHHLEVRDDGVWVRLRDERVPTVSAAIPTHGAPPTSPKSASRPIGKRPRGFLPARRILLPVHARPR